ncbi:hypothetical protein J4E91_011110 [Alternaria rosae]|nr:hypothetical protein J4E91_011110 [Alternaria rosae]
MLDRERLEGEVLIFWVPDLLDEKRGDVEYVAHGCIRGRGYTAVPFEQLDFNQLYSLCPQIPRSKENKKKVIDFGHKLRKKMFSSTPVDVSDGNIETAKSRTGEKRKRVESDAEYDSDTESNTDIDEYSNRVRRPYGLRSRPTTPTAKKAEADEYDLKWLDEEDVSDEEMEEESDEEMIDVKDRGEKEMFKEDIDEEDLNGRLPDGTMQDGDLSDSSDIVMTDETIRPPEGRNYVYVPSWEPGRLGVIVAIMDDYGNVMG